MRKIYVIWTMRCRVSWSWFSCDAKTEQRLCSQCNRYRRPDQYRSVGRHRLRLADLRQDRVHRAPRLPPSLETLLRFRVVLGVRRSRLCLHASRTDLRRTDRVAVSRDRSPGVRIYRRQTGRRARPLFPVVQSYRMVGRALRQRQTALCLRSQPGERHSRQPFSLPVGDFRS